MAATKSKDRHHHADDLPKKVLSPFDISVIARHVGLQTVGWPGNPRQARKL